MNASGGAARSRWRAARVAIAGSVAVALILTLALAGAGSTWRLLVLMLAIALVVAWVRRGRNPRTAARAILALAVGAGLTSTLLGALFGDKALPNDLAALAVALLGVAIVIDAAGWSVAGRLGARTRDIMLHRARLPVAAIGWSCVGLLAFSAIALLAGTSLGWHVWPYRIAQLAFRGTRAYAPGDLLGLLSALDGLIGALSVFALARKQALSPPAAAFAALAWLVAGPRVAVAWLTPLPTFAVPALALGLTLRARRSAVRPMLAEGALLALCAAYAPAVALAAFGAAFALAWSYRRFALLGPALLGLLAGSVLFTSGALPHPLLGPMVSPALDPSLRAAGADGIWPWELLYPAVDAALFAPLTRDILAGLGRGGNVLWLAGGVGWGALLAMIFAAATRQRPAVSLRAWWLVVGLGAVLVLPSHAHGVPLPTPAAFAELLGASAGLTLVAGKLLLAIGMASIVGEAFARIARFGNPWLQVIVTVTLLATPAFSAYSVDIRYSGLRGALLEAQSLGTPTLVAPSLTRGDWAWRYAAYLARGHRAKLVTLPVALAGGPGGFEVASAVVVAPDAALARQSGPFAALVVVPRAFERNRGRELPTELPTCFSALHLLRVLPRQGVYRAGRGCAP